MENNVAVIRAFDRVSDYALVASWWREPVELSALSRDGYFCVVEGVEAACGWLYVCNSSDVARVSHLVLNPQVSEAGQLTARAVLLDFLKNEAAQIGKMLTVDEAFAGHALAVRHALPDDFADRIQAEMMRFDEADLPLTHRFTPGMYIRQILMPAGHLVASRIHRTEHPYVISQGDISVWTREDGLVRLRAPHTGLTRPGTRRILYAHEDTIWTTFHATDATNPEEIINTICDVPVLPAHLLQTKEEKL